MKNAILLKIHAVFIVIFFLFSCGQNRNIYFVAESFFWEVIGENSGLTRELDKTANVFNFSFYKVISDDNHPDVIQSILQDQSSAIVILSPFMNNLAIDISNQYKDNLFIIFGNIIETELPENLLTVTFDRTNNYREAGKYIAELIENSKSFKDNTKVGIIVSNISRQTEYEVAAFKQGIEEITDPDIITEKVLLNTADHALIRSTIENMRNNGVYYFLFKVFQSNLYCLEILDNLGGYAVVEDWSRSKIFEEHVILSVEEDYASTIGRCLELLEIKEGRIHWKSNKINGIAVLE